MIVRGGREENDRCDGWMDAASASARRCYVGTIRGAADDEKGREDSRTTPPSVGRSAPRAKWSGQYKKSVRRS